MSFRTNQAAYRKNQKRMLARWRKRRSRSQKAASDRRCLVLCVKVLMKYYRSILCRIEIDEDVSLFSVHDRRSTNYLCDVEVRVWRSMKRAISRAL